MFFRLLLDIARVFLCCYSYTYVQSPICYRVRSLEIFVCIKHNITKKKKKKMELPRGRVLRQLCRQGNIEMVRRMLEAGVPVDAPQEDGCTGLWLAAEAGCAEVVKLLAEAAGANVNAVKTAGNISALYVAAQNGHLTCVDVLLVNGANPNVAKSTGATPIFIAAQQGYAEIVGSLLKASCNPNAPTQQGVTPLMIAAFQGHQDVTRKLLAGGADANLVGQGRTALDWAKSNAHHMEYQRVLDDHLRDMEAEVRRRQQLLAKTGAGVQRGGGGGGAGSPTRGGAGGGGDTQSQAGGPSEISSESGLAYGGAGGRGTSASGRSVAGGGGAASTVASKAGLQTTVSKAASKTSAEQEAAELPFAIQDVAETLDTMQLRSTFLIPSIARAVSATPGRAGTPGPSAVAAKTSSFYTRPLSKGAGRMDRSLGLYGGMTAATIAEEERRAREFRSMVKRDHSAASNPNAVMPNLASANGTISRQNLYNVEQQWESHRDRVAGLIVHGTEAQSVLSRNLGVSREANTNYALRAMEMTPAFRAVRQNAADERNQSAGQHQRAGSPEGQKQGFNFPRLPSKKISALHDFMSKGRDAKGPPGGMSQSPPR